MKLVHIILHMVNMLGQATWIQIDFNSYLCERVVIRGRLKALVWFWWIDETLGNGDGDPDLLSGRGNYRCGGEWHTDPASDRKIEPCNLSTIAPLVINRVTDQVDLAKKANPCLRNEEHKQEQERTQPNCRWMINLTKLGSHKPMNGETVLDRII